MAYEQVDCSDPANKELRNAAWAVSGKRAVCALSIARKRRRPRHRAPSHPRPAARRRPPPPRADPQLFSKADDGALTFLGDWDAVQALSESNAEHGGLTAALAAFPTT